jgi:hypothetical protein
MRHFRQSLAPGSLQLYFLQTIATTIIPKYQTLHGNWMKRRILSGAFSSGTLAT